MQHFKGIFLKNVSTFKEVHNPQKVKNHGIKGMF